MPAFARACLLAAAVIGGLGCAERPETGESEPGALQNGDFTRASLEPWALEDRTAGGCRAEVATVAGRRAARLQCERGIGPLVAAARLVQKIDATPLRGHRVHVRSGVWSEPAPVRSGVGRLVATAVKNNGERLFRAESTGRGGASWGEQSNWVDERLVVEVPDDADQLVVELAAHGAGAYAIANVEVERGTANTFGNLPPAPLGDGEEDHLIALARLLGVLRFFGPSSITPTAGQAIDWDLATIAAVDRLAAAAAGDLESQLLDLFAGTAPGLSFSGEPPPACRDGHAHRSWLGAPFDVPMAAFEVRTELLEDTARRSVEVALPGGLIATVPIGACVGQPVQPAPKPERPAGWAPSPGDRSTRLAIAVLGWSALEQFDPERAPGDPAWEARLRVALRDLAVATSPTTALEHLVGATNDGHAVLGRPEGGREFRLPLVAAELADGVVVTRVASSVDALQVGDRLVRFDGDVIEVRLADAVARTAGATPAHRRARALDNLLYLPRPRLVEIVVEGLDGTIRELSVSAQPAGSLGELQHTARPPFLPLGEGRLYVDLSRTNDTSWHELLPNLTVARALILDLRGYPGISEASLGFFSDVPLSGPRFCIPERDQPGPGRPQCQRWEVPPQAPRLRAKVVVLADANAMSYAETLLTMFAEHHLATIVGLPSAGTNGNFTGIWLPAGYRLYFTGMSADGPHGSLRGHGVCPDVVVQPTRQGVASGHDEILEVALQQFDS